MLCKKPYMAPGRKAYPCGQCLPCRINKKREWMHRIILEASMHSDNCFLTLTYADEHLPEGASLVPRHLTLFVKRLRKSIQDQRTIRFFGVGEYGEKTERPHYHLAVFGYPSCGKGTTARNRRGSCCSVCDSVQQLWHYGHTYIGQLSPASAGYIAGYVTKKLTKPDDPRLNGRHPEFTRMSLRPGIGADFMDETASALLQHNLDARIVDVPVALRHGRTLLPLGRYLRKRLRTRIGRDEKTPPEVLALQEAKLQALWQDAEAYAPIGSRRDYVRNRLMDQAEGKAAQVEARHRRRNKGTL